MIGTSVMKDLNLLKYPLKIFEEKLKILISRGEYQRLLEAYSESVKHLSNFSMFDCVPNALLTSAAISFNGFTCIEAADGGVL